MKKTNFLRLCSSAWRYAIAAWVIASLILLVYISDVELLVVTVTQANLLHLLLYIPSLILAFWAIRSIRWALILWTTGARINFLRVYLSTAASLGLAAITPAQSGELLKIKHVCVTDRIDAWRATGGFAAERVYDAVVLLALAILATAITMKSMSQDFATVALMAAVGLTFVALAVTLAPAGQLHNRLIDLLEGFKATLRDPKIILALVGLTALSWVVNALLWKVSMSSVGVDVALTTCIAIVGLVSFASLASMVPSGIGVLEVTVSGSLIFLGFTPEQALSAALMLRVITLWVVLLGSIHWALLPRAPLSAVPVATAR